MGGQDNTQEEQGFFQQLQKQKEFDIIPCEEHIDFGDEKRFEMLKLTPEQKLQVSELLQHVPAAAATGAMAGAYTVSFPKGLPHTLISLQQGGYGSQILDNGRIVGSASFHPMLGQAAVLGVFTVMSIATGQFFLAKINKELHMINRTLDEIMKFLYGDKRAELLSELNFVKYARDNYVSIMAHELHRVATISSIQEAKKVAMKDIEFYMNDLENQIKSAPKKYFEDLKKKMDNEIKQARENLDFSLQLYLMSSLMEVYYAQNYEKDYVDNFKNDIKGYVKSCNDQMHRNYGTLRAHLENCHASAKDKHELKQYTEELQSKLLLDQEYDDICEKLYAVLDTSTKSAEYYLKADGDSYNVYYKVS